MNKKLLVATLVLLGALGFTFNAQANCSLVVWGSDILADNPNIGDACLEVVEKNGVEAVKLHARVVRQGVNSTIVQWQLPDGSWSPAQRRFPERGASAEIGGQTVRIADLAARQEVNIYVPAGAETWSFPPEPVAAAAPPPPPPPPPPAPEPEPEVLPTTATQLPLFALLGGLFILLGGMVSVVRTRL